MMARKWIVALVVCLVASSAGCSAWPKWSSGSTGPPPPPLTQAQQDWWQANKDRAIYIPARGYYVQGVGYFDADGHLKTDANAEKIARANAVHKAKEDPYDGWLFKKMTGQGDPATTAASSTTAAPAPVAAAGAQGVGQAQPVSYTPSNAPASGQFGQPAQPGQPGYAVGAASNGTYTPPKTDDDDPKGVAQFYPSNFEKTWLKWTGQKKDQHVSQSAYDEGEALFRQAKYAEAADKFKIAAKRWPDSAVEEDSLFLQAECEFFLDRYSAANDDYQELLVKYPNSRHLDKAVTRRFAIARYWQELDKQHHHWLITPNFIDNERPMFDTAGHALATYDKIRLEDPTGPLADDAIMATANTYFVNGRYADADYYYTLLRKDYPRSEHVMNAFKLGLQAKIRCYQGAQYDPTPLVEADKLIDQMLTQFPREMADEKDRLLVTKKEVHANMADRDYRMAQYYDKGGHYGAARWYYASVVKKYPDSSFAQLAQQRVDAIKTEPDNPPDRFEFLARWFGEEKNNPNAIASAPATPAVPAATAAVPGPPGSLSPPR